MHYFRTQSGPLTSNNFFSENLLASLVFFIHSYLHAKNQGQILIYLWNTDDLRILKSHWLRAIFAFTWELDFSQPCSFLRMLMNHKNFYFTQIPNKTNDVIFLKSPGPFLTIFTWWEFFPKNPALSHTTIYGPLTLC